MNFSQSPCKSAIAEQAKAAGVSALGIADACEVSAVDIERYRKWIADGCHGEMSYLERYDDVRSDPRQLLDGAQSLIVTAFNYFPKERPSGRALRIASYALGRDYHEVVRERLEIVAAYIRQTWGGQTRVCVDTAPLRERYWAMRAGVGFIGRNCQLIIPGQGSYFFLGTILTTVHFAPNEPIGHDCGGCNACRTACPSGALRGDGTMDARRCLSYLTIEYRGELPDDCRIGSCLYGCDACQDACPHNRGAKPTEIEDFMPSEELLALTDSDMENMTQEEFSAIFGHSAIKRTKLAGLQRNLRAIKR